VNLEWRSGSGAAHGLVWQFPGRAVTAKVWEADEHNVARYHSEPDIGEFASRYMFAFRMAERAWGLFRERGAGSSVE
jgi:hypothetical protein